VGGVQQGRISQNWIFHFASFLRLGLSALFGQGHRIGTVCGDSWRSSAIGPGACSHHDGVAHWNNAETPIGDRVSEFAISLGLGLTGALLVRQSQSQNQDRPNDIEQDFEQYLPKHEDDLP